MPEGEQIAGAEGSFDCAVTVAQAADGVADGEAELGRIDQYVLKKELGGGGYGTVFLAMDTVSGLDVAVKGLPPDVRCNREELDNVRANFALVAKLHHPNIAAALVLHPAVRVSYSSRSVEEKLRVESGDTLMVMEYAPGETLSKWAKRFPGKRVPLQQAMSIAWQIAAALDYAHEQRILHRDVKPANVMVDVSGEGARPVRVLDFGIAAEIRTSMGRVSREIHDTSGTRPYMAPEQWSGDRQGPRSDQYSLAVLFYELVTGDVPFASVFETGMTAAMLAAVLRKEPDIPASLPKAVRRALARALSKKPEARFSSCRDFVAAMNGGSGHAGLMAFGIVAVAVCAAGLWYASHAFRSAECPAPDGAGAMPAASAASESVPAIEESEAASAEPAASSEEVRKRIEAEEAERRKRGEAARLAEERRIAEAKKAAEEESRKTARERAAAEEARKAAAAKLEEARREAEAARKKAAEAAERKRAAEEKEAAEAARRAAEEAKHREEALKAQEARRKTVQAAPAALQEPTLTVAAMLDGRVVSGATMKMMSGDVVLPYKWEGRLTEGRSFGPYIVSYSYGGREYVGEFRVTVDWRGPKTVPVHLRALGPGEQPGGIRAKPKGRGAWAF